MHLPRICRVGSGPSDCRHTTHIPGLPSSTLIAGGSGYCTPVIPVPGTLSQSGALLILGSGIVGSTPVTPQCLAPLNVCLSLSKQSILDNSFPAFIYWWKGLSACPMHEWQLPTPAHGGISSGSSKKERVLLSEPYFFLRGEGADVTHSFTNKKANTEELALLPHALLPSGGHSLSTQGEGLSRSV